MTDIIEEEVQALDPEKKAAQLPEPKGFKILCVIPDIEDKYDSGLIKAEKTVRNEELMATVLFVVKMGPDCYKDESRFPSGPYCKEGDFVVVRPLAGVRLAIHGKAFRLINDDCVEAVVEDPRGISRGI
jgi:hypothetical protein